MMSENLKKIIKYYPLILVIVYVSIIAYIINIPNKNLRNTKDSDYEKNNFVINSVDTIKIDTKVPVVKDSVKDTQIINNSKSNEEVTKQEANSVIIADSKIVTEEYNLTKNTVTEINLLNNEYSSYVIRWEKGSLSSGSSVNELLNIQPELDEGPTLKGFVSNLIYAKDEKIYIKSSSDTKLYIDYLGVEYEKPLISKIADIQNPDSGAKYSSLPIISRDVWGALPSSWDPNSSLDIDDPARLVWGSSYFRPTKFVIHHTASPNTSPDYSKAVRDIYLYHAYSRGWGDIGYNYLIDSQGNIYEGKHGGEGVYGYHAYTEANTMSIGISLIGDFTQYPPSYEAKQSLIKLLAEKSVFYKIPISLSDSSLDKWLSTSTTVYGHKDTYFWCYSDHPLSYLCSDQAKWVRNNTACPGSYLINVMSSEIIPAANNYKSSNFYELSSAVNETNQIINATVGEISQIIVQYNLPSDTSPSVIEAKLPKFSGISKYQIIGNKVIITIGDYWNDGVIYSGFDGFYASGTYFPPSEGKTDRTKTLLIIFKMDPDVVSAGTFNMYRLD